MSFFTQNPGGFKTPQSVLVQRSLKPITNIMTKKPFLPTQVGGESDYGPTMSGFPGEKHVYMKTDAGLVRANFAGPGTNLKERLARGDKPINEVDRISMAHDLRYGLAKNYDDVRQADKIMIKALQNSKDKSLTNKTAKALMQGKLVLENTGMAKPGYFAQHAMNQTPQELAAYQALLNPLAQQGYGPAFSGTPGTDQYHQPALGSVKKGSQAAKDHMARLRSMRKKKGGALRLAGNGLMMAGSGKLAKKKMIRNKTQAGGLGFIALAIPTLLGLTLKAAASYGVSRAADAAIKKIVGKGQAGGGPIDNIKSMLGSVAPALKEKAISILEKLKGNPELLEDAFKALLPIITSMAKQMITEQTGGMSQHEELTGSYSADHEALEKLEGPGFLQHVVSFFGKEILKTLKNIVSGKKSGYGIFKNLERGVSSVKDKVSDVTDKLAAGLSSSELQTVKSIISDVTRYPSVLENPQYLATKGRELSPLGQRLLNDLLRKQGIPVAISVRV